jgi:hypothetical protein
MLDWNLRLKVLCLQCSLEIVENTAPQVRKDDIGEAVTRA